MDEEHQELEMQSTGFGLAGSYLKTVVAMTVGAAIGLGIYFLMSGNAGNAAADPGIGAANQLCVCPNCGMAIDKPAGIDCEEINCPNCANPMTNGARLAAATAMAQNQRETLAEQGLLSPLPMNQNPAPVMAPLQFPQARAIEPQPAAADLLGPMARDMKCVCPNCGKTIDLQPGMSCANTRCPNCGSAMTNAIPIGGRDLQLAAANNFGAGGMAQQYPNNSFGNGAAQYPTPAAAATAPCPHTMLGIGGSALCPNVAANTAPCPGAAGGGQPPCVINQAGNTGTGVQDVTYTNTVQGIVQRNCLRCHGGPIRTLNTYDQVRNYALNGLLEMMIQPGGPMSRFLTAHEAHQISAWIKAGAPY